MFCVIAKTKQNRTNSKSWVYQKKKTGHQKVHRKNSSSKTHEKQVFLMGNNFCFCE